MALPTTLPQAGPEIGTVPTPTADFSLAGKVIVVTGGTGVLGHSFLAGIVAAGGAVAILGRNSAVA